MTPAAPMGAREELERGVRLPQASPHLAARDVDRAVAADDYQSLNAEFALKGIHVVHIVIDGSVDAPDTLGKMLGPERFHELRETRGNEHDGLILPAQVAETYLHLAKQHRSTWTHEIDIRLADQQLWRNGRGVPHLAEQRPRFEPAAGVDCIQRRPAPSRRHGRYRR
jgi:hypothetical protein